MQRQPFTMRLEPRTSPIRHRSHRLKAMAIAGTFTRVRAADRLGADQFGRPIVPRLMHGVEIRRRMEIAAPYVPQNAIGQPLTVTTGQGTFRRSLKGGTVGRQKLASKARNQGIKIGIVRLRCCHWAALHGMVLAVS
jgi:hypothetical protein